MEYDDFCILLRNLAPDQIDTLATIAIRVATIRAEGWTGEITFSVNSNQGSICDVHVNRREVVKIGTKKRGIRGGANI